MPAHLDETERSIWHEYVAVLGRLGVLATTDAAALMLTVCAHADFIRCAEQCHRDGTVQEKADGTSVEAPWARAKRAHADQLRRMIAVFGLSPADRPQITKIDKAENDVSKFIAGPGASA
jgi:P27 family predicted phage terminase small subunit